MDQPESYQDANKQTLKDGKEYLDNLRKTISWTKGETILDVGCGPGNFTVNILLSYAPDDAKIVGCDISKNMIDYARATFTEPRAFFQQMDIESDRIWDQWAMKSFTKIFSFYCFQWIDKYREAAQNMFSLLKPNGEVFLMYLGHHMCLHQFKELRNSRPWRNIIKGRHYFKKITEGTIADRMKAFSDELQKVGFMEVQAKVRGQRYTYSSKEKFLNLMRSLDPYRKYIPDHLLEEYEASFAEKLGKTGFTDPESGDYIIQYALFMFRARKPTV